MPNARGNDSVPVGQGATSDGGTDKINDLRHWLRVPKDIEVTLTNAKSIRDWMEGILLKDVPNTVVTHHVLRNQEAKMAHLTATKPQSNFQPRKKFHAKAGEPQLVPPELVRFGETMELLVNFFMDFGDLRDAANNAARDADTVRAGWLKLIWRQDPDMTPVGAHIFDAELHRVFRFKHLRDKHRRDEFPPDSSEAESMKNLEDGIRTDLINQLTQQISSDPQAQEDTAVAVEGEQETIIATSIDPRQSRVQELLAGSPISDEELQDIPRFLGFDFDVIDIEDIRLDWTIDRPEYYMKSRRMGHRTRMTTSEITQKYNLTEAQKKELDTKEEEVDHQSTVTSDKHRGDVQNTTATTPNLFTNMHDVWEVWDRSDNTVYVFTENVNFMLHQFIPRNVGPHWFPFFYLWMHEMAGRIYAPSSVELQMSLQDELNSIRTHAREYRAASLPRLFIGKDAMTEDEINKFENSHAFQVIEVERPDEIQKTLFPFQGIAYNPAIVSTSEPFLDLQLTAGMPTSGLGGIGNAKLATEVAFAGEQLQTQLDRTKFLFNTFLKRIATEMAYIIIRALPYENAVAIGGPGIEFPLNPEEREQLLVDLILSVDTSPTGKPNVEKELQHIQVIAAIFANQGMQLKPEFLAGRISNALNIETDWNDIIANVGPLPKGGNKSNSTQTPSGQPTGPAPGTPGGGFDKTPTTAELPGGQTPAV